MVSIHLLIRLKRLACPPSFWRGRTQEQIAEVVSLSQNRVSEIIGNDKFCEIDNLLSQGRNMDYIARHYHIYLPLAWAIRLEGKTDRERFEGPGWGLRTWDQWSFKEWDIRFCDDWPARHVPAIGFAFRRGGRASSLGCLGMAYPSNPKCQVHSEKTSHLYDKSFFSKKAKFLMKK